MLERVFGNSSKNDGKRSTHKVRDAIERTADALAEQEYQKGFSELVTLEDCIKYYRGEVERLDLVDASGFVVSVKKNYDPRNDNDNYLVIQGLVDRQSKPITVRDESVSRVIHTRTIDDALIRVLNGKETALVHV